VNPVTHIVYTASDSGAITVVSGLNSLVGTIPVAIYARGIAVNDATNRVYAAHLGSQKKVSVVDGATNGVLTVIDTPPSGDIVSAAVNSVTNRVYVANQFTDLLHVIDGGTNTVVTSVGVGATPLGIAVNETTNRIYVVNRNGDSVSVINGATNTVVTTITVGNNPHGAAVNELTNRVYVTNTDDSTVSMINGATNAVINTIAVPGSPGGIAVNAATGRAYVGLSSGLISVIDTTNDTVLTSFAVSADPRAVAVDPVLNQVYSVSLATNSLDVINGATNAIVANIPVASGVYGVAVNPVTHIVYTASDSGAITVINGLVDGDADNDAIKDSADSSDSDGDGVTDSAEHSCGGVASVGTLRPERVDGMFVGTDDDTDATIDELLPAAASAFDCDGDGYTRAEEANVYSYLPQTTGDQKTCQQYDMSFPNTNPEVRPSLRWPADLNLSPGPIDSFNRINLLDLTTLLAPTRYFDTNVGTNPDDVRFDLVPGPGLFMTDINIEDLTALLAGTKGFPPMLGGARAFDGSACPYAP
jgi:YVTN family beta-propeller protein